MNLVRTEGSVWCTVHGVVHDETTDPYGYGDEVPECTREDWRTLYHRPRKGDEEAT